MNQVKEVNKQKERRAAVSLARAGATIRSLARAEFAEVRRGGKRRDPRLEKLDQELESLRREQEKERLRKEDKERERIVKREREIGMLQKLIQVMASDKVFDGHQERWDLGEVSCFIHRAAQDKWITIVVALERSKLMVRKGWADLLGVYLSELDDKIRLKRYARIAPDEIKGFGEIMEFLKERGLASNIGEQAKKWQSFQFQQSQEREEGIKKRSARSFHKSLTSTELEALEIIADAGGKIHPINLGGMMGYSSQYARALCNTLGRADYVDCLSSGYAAITPLGREELKRKRR